jgi:hypothetical protein
VYGNAAAAKPDEDSSKQPPQQDRKSHMHDAKEVTIREALGRELAGHFWEDWEGSADVAARPCRCRRAAMRRDFLYAIGYGEERYSTPASDVSIEKVCFRFLAADALCRRFLVGFVSIHSRSSGQRLVHA